MNLTKDEKLKELECFYSNDYLVEKLQTQTIDQLFDDHVNKHSIEIEIGELFENSEYIDSSILIDTPDGFQQIGDFVMKSKRECFTVITENNNSISCSEDHLCEIQENNWKKVKDLRIGQSIITNDGISNISEIIQLETQEVYDFEVLHENHRYWGGTGISSHNTGKTYVCMNVAREAQKKGYFVFYIDTEGAIDSNAFTNFGVDINNNFKYYRMGLVSDVKFFIKSIIDAAKQMKEEGMKAVIFVDSLGHLEGNKEKMDLEKGKTTADMGTRAKELRAAFKSFTLDLSNLKFPLIFTNHVYSGQDQYAGKSMGGGLGPMFAASAVLFLGKSDIKDEGKTRTGILVRSNIKKSRLTRPINIQFHISFHKGMNEYVGLEEYISWENCGVERGNKLTEKEFSKLKGAEAESCKPFEIDGETFYFLPKAKARNYIIKHSGEKVPIRELFSDKVFTMDVLKELDEKIIQPKFKFPTYQSILDAELDDLIDAAESENDELGVDV